MELDKLEYYTLSKLIHFVKFNCKDYEARYFAGSPIIGEILNKVVNELDSEKINADYFNLETEGQVFNLVFNGIKQNLDITIEWDEMPEELRIEHIKNLAFPYILSEEQIEILYKYKQNNN